MFYDKKPYFVISRKTGNEIKFYLRFTVDGKSREKVLKNCSDRTKAEAVAQSLYCKILKDQLEGKTEEKEYSHRESSILMSTAINKVFLDTDALYFEVNKVSVQQESIYKGRCNRYLLPFFMLKKINNVTVDDIIAFRKLLKKKYKLSDKTMHEVERLIRIVMKWIPDLYPKVKNYRNPFDSFMLKTITFDKEAIATPAFEVDEIRAIFSVQWDNYPCLCMSLISAFTGMRSNEVACLRKCKFIPSVDYCIIKVDENWTFSERKVKAPKTKNGTRKVVIPRWLYDFIFPVLDSVPDGSFPFHNSRSTEIPLKGDRYNLALRKAVTKAGFLDDYKRKGLHFYSFRSFYRSYVEITLGEESALLRYVMGHSRKDIDDHYFKFLDAHIPRLLSATENLLPDYKALFSQKCFIPFKNTKHDNN